MIRPLLLALLIVAACAGNRPGRYLLDREALNRVMQNDKEGAAKVSTDADIKFSADPGDEFYIPWYTRKSRQLHVYSGQRHSTTVIDATALHKQKRIVVIASYVGSPPPPPRLLKRKG